jgi:hypothetical protein
MILHASTLSPCNLQTQPSQDDTASTTEYPALVYSDGSYENGSYENGSYDNGSYDYDGTAGLLTATGDSYGSSSGAAAAAYYEKRTSFDTADTAEVCMYMCYCVLAHKSACFYSVAVCLWRRFEHTAPQCSALLCKFTSHTTRNSTASSLRAQTVSHGLLSY